MAVLSERKKEILRVIIEQYVETAEPVGSKSVAAEFGSAISSATIRNEMAELEMIGLLEQPHTSAGRVPTVTGYRVYVNDLMRRHRLSKDDTIEINSALQTHESGRGSPLEGAGDIASRITAYPAYAVESVASAVTVSRFDFILIDSFSFIIVLLLSNDSVQNKLVRIIAPVEQGMITKLGAVFNAMMTGLSEDKITLSLISSVERSVGDTIGIVAVIASYTLETLCEAKSGHVKIAGAMNLLNHPEYKDIDKARRLLNYLSDDKELARLPSPETIGEIKITIGSENLAEELRDSSVVVARFEAGGEMQGLIGIVGPTRMDYSKVTARLSYIAQGLRWLFMGSDTAQFSVDMRIKKSGDDDDG